MAPNITVPNCEQSFLYKGLNVWVANLFYAKDTETLS